MNKSGERKIFDFVYFDRISNYSIIESENPDFKINEKISYKNFGVEITELYLSDSLARLNNVPEYLNSILTKEKYIHKDDKIHLKVSNLEIESKDGVKKGNVKGIIHQKNIDTFLNKVIEIIEKKNKKFSNYDKNLNHVNLIIYDCESFFIGLNSDNFYKVFFNKKIEKVLLNSNFREIFLVTEIGEYLSVSKVYIPLKCMFLIAEAYTFNYIIVKYYSNRKYFTKKGEELFIEYLKWRGVKNIFYRKNKDKKEVIFGNYGIYTKENGLNLVDYNDCFFDSNYKIIENKKFRKFFDNDFEIIFNKVNNKNHFCGGPFFKTNNHKLTQPPKPQTEK